MTLLKSGKLQELTEEIAKIQTEILALQETRWPGKGQINKKAIYSTIAGPRRRQAKQPQVSYS
jgi:transposase